MSAFNALGAALYSRLSGTSGLTTLLAAGTASIYNILAPDNAALDYVVFNVQAGGDDRTSGHRTKNLVLFVRAYSGTGPAKAGNIHAQIDAALNMKPLTITGWSNFWLSAERDLEAVEVDEANTKTWMRGSYYRVRIEST